MEVNGLNGRWFAIRTQPRREHLARTHYQRQGFHVYFPRILKLRRHARKVDFVPRPLFPGYLFLNLESHQEDWTTISSTIGAVGPVRFGNFFPPVPAWFIEMLRNREDGDGFVRLSLEQKTGLRPGLRVKVICADMTEIEGIFQGLKGKDRALVLLDLLKRQIPTVVDLGALEPAQ